MKILVLDEDYGHYQALLSSAGLDADGGKDPTVFARGYDALLAQPDLASHYLQLGHKVPWIQSTWAGVDRLVPACQSADTLVTGIKGVFGPQIAEYVFAFLLQQSRDLITLRLQQETGFWSPHLPATLAGKTLLVLGTGSIGAHLAAVAEAFGMRTLGVSRSGRPVDPFSEVVASDQLATVAPTAQVLVNTLPSTPETRGILNSALFERLREDVVLFNVGRGDALSEDALRVWLDTRPKARAVLDVFSQEPLPPNHWLWQHPQISITPHVAAVSFVEDVTAVFLDNLRRWRDGLPLEHVIDMQQGY